MYQIFTKATTNADISSIDISSILVSSYGACLTTTIDLLEATETVSAYSVFHIPSKTFHSRSMYPLNTENTIEKWKYPLPESFIITESGVWEQSEYHREFGDSLTHDIKRVTLWPDWIPEDFDLDTLTDLWYGNTSPTKDYPFPIGNF